MSAKFGDIPLFIVAGMPRTGTTFLYYYLNQHPDIYLPFRKEVNFFNVNYERGSDWYKSLYREVSNELIMGDISPPCFLDTKSISRMLDFSKIIDIKIILIVRDPAEWAVSFYKQFNTYVSMKQTFEEYLKEGYSIDFGRKHLELSFSGNWISERVSEYISTFKNNLLLYKFDYFKANPLKTLNILEEFLGVRNHFNSTNFDNRRINESQRRNIRLLSWFFSRELIIEAIGRTFPRNIIVQTRSAFDKYSARTKGPESKTKTQSDVEIALARNYLSKQCDGVSKIFERSEVLVGSRPASELYQAAR